MLLRVISGYGGYDDLAENREHLRELKKLAAEKGVLSRIDFEPSCSISRRNALPANCMCHSHAHRRAFWNCVAGSNGSQETCDCLQLWQAKGDCDAHGDRLSLSAYGCEFCICHEVTDKGSEHF